MAQFNADEFMTFDGRLDTTKFDHQSFLSNHLSFDSRDSYLEWRSEWRSALQLLVREIKKQIHISRTDLGSRQSNAMSRREYLRVQGFNMMVLRNESKKLCRVQMKVHEESMVAIELALFG